MTLLVESLIKFNIKIRSLTDFKLCNNFALQIANYYSTYAYIRDESNFFQLMYGTLYTFLFVSLFSFFKIASENKMMKKETKSLSSKDYFFLL